jgi:glycosyltransferase involved in cell wall biosynthesis
MIIACFASATWDGVWQRHQQIMERFAERGHTIIYVEPTNTVQAIRKPGILVRRVAKKDGVILVRPIFSPLHYHFHSLERIDLTLVSRLFKGILAGLGAQKVDVLWLFSPFFAFVMPALDYELLVYDCADECDGFLSSVRAKDWILGKENEVLEKADLVFVTSQRLFERCARVNSNIHRAPNGVPLSFFEKRLRANHSDIERIKRPIAGFVGSLAFWLDYEMLHKAAVSNEDLSFVFVGPITTQEKAIKALKQLDNVHFLGAKEHADIPDYVSCFDVCLIPFKVQNLTLGAQPIKLLEYFAAGKPVVSSKLDEVIRFKNCVYLANADTFEHQIREALREHDPQLRKDRMDIARKYSWESIVSGIEHDLVWALESKIEGKRAV